YTAFAASRRIASGELADVASEVRQQLDRGLQEPVLIFNDATSQVAEVDFRGSLEDVQRRLAAREQAPAGDTTPNEPRGPGRPKLGVVAREVTLLPRHWKWLAQQPGGASVALRKLVELARRTNEGADRVRQSQDVAYRFMLVLAGNLPGYEE